MSHGNISRCDRGHAVNGAHHVGLDPFQVIGEEFVAKALRCSVLGPEFEVFLIGADQEALALLAQVIFAVPVCDGGEAVWHGLNLGDGFGDEVLMFGGLQREGDPGHGGHLASPQACGVDHNRSYDVSFGGFDDPSAV